MKFGISYSCFSKNWEGNNYVEIIERVRRCGFDVLEIFYSRILTMSQEEIRNIKSACEANNIELYGCGGFTINEDISNSDNTIRKSAIVRCKDIIDALNKIGIKNFSGINYGAWCDFSMPIEKEKKFENASKSLQEICDYAEQYDITWNMEVVNRFESVMLNTAQEALLLTKMVDRDNLKILLDTFHSMIEEDDMVQAIIDCGSKLGHYHMGTNNRKLPADCIIPWDDICNALNKIEYDRCISFEPLLHTGGSVAQNGGHVWREMLPLGTDDDKLDKMLVESLNYIKRKL